MLYSMEVSTSSHLPSLPTVMQHYSLPVCYLYSSGVLAIGPASQDPFLSTQGPFLPIFVGLAQ